MTMNFVNIDNDVWFSMQRRKEGTVTNQEALEFLILDFVLKDLQSDIKTIISKQMLEDRRIKFRALLEAHRKKKTENLLGE